ncbi:unnamed protein product [Prorocentrum cordatum]|uniref:Uncharacterized protein n=1 Tax=Prorocentrum cordatum TaxID=2364126 RepID=A0ABN9UXJ8_9DINO|nr:unnamed protein product [Polarella glacialis]
MASEQQEQDAAPGAPEEELLPYSGDDDLVTRYLNCAKGVFTAWLALDDLEPDLGPLEYACGSHLWPLPQSEGYRPALFGRKDYRTELEKAAAHAGQSICVTQVLVPQGGGSVHDGRTWHGSGVNRSGRPRRGLGVHFGPRGARPTPPTALARRITQASDASLARSEAAAQEAREVPQAAEEKRSNPEPAAGRPVNPLVEGSLLESQEASQDGWAIDAPGSNKLVFSCRLGDADMRVFSQAFSSSAAQLTRLDLSCNQVTDAGAATLARSLLGARAQSLWSLSLRANAIGSPGCEVLVEALKYCPALRRLDMSQNPVGKGGGLALVELLQFSMSLLELYLADTEADIDVLVAMSTTLLLAQPGLKVLSLENPRICTKQEDHTVHLGRMLRVNTGISEIYLGKCKFRDEGIRQLVSFLMENKTLRVLDLRCNEIGADGASHLGTLLGSDCQLSLLNLSSNRIGERQNVSGARALATALLGNRMLRALDLSNNMLCGEALSSIGQALETNSTLETIALFHNEWDQESSFKFHKLLTNRARILPLRMDFVTSEVDFKIDICKVWDFTL